MYNLSLICLNKLKVTMNKEEDLAQNANQYMDYLAQTKRFGIISNERRAAIIEEAVHYVSNKYSNHKLAAITTLFGCLRQSYRM